MANSFDIFCDGLMKGTDVIYSQYNCDVEKQFTALTLFRDDLIDKFKSLKANHANTKIKPKQKRKLDGINEEEDEDGSKKRVCPFNEMAVLPFDFAGNNSVPEKLQHSTPNKDAEMLEGDISAIIAGNPRTKRNASVTAAALNNKLLNEKLSVKKRGPSSREMSQQGMLLDKLPYVLLNNTLKQNVQQYKLSLPKKNSLVQNGIQLMMESTNVDIVISVNEQDKENTVPETVNTTVGKVKTPEKTNTTIKHVSPEVTRTRSTRSIAVNKTMLTLDDSRQKELEAHYLSIMPPPVMPVIKPKRGRPAQRKNTSNNTTVEVELSESDCTVNTTATRKTRSKRKASTREINTSEVANESASRSTRATRASARSILEPPPPISAEKPKRTRTKRGKAAAANNHSEMNSETTETVIEFPKKEVLVTSDSDDQFEHKKVKHVRPKRTRKGKAKLPTTPRPPTPPTPPVVEFPPEEKEDPTEKRPSHDSGVSSTGKSEQAAKEASNDATITHERMEEEDDRPLVPTKVLRSSNRMETDAKKTNSCEEDEEAVSQQAQQMNVSYVVLSKEQKVVLNETIVLEKVKGLSRETVVLSSPKQQNLPEATPAHQVFNETITLSSKPLDQTVTINKGELIQYDPNESLLTDDLSEVEETPPRPAKGGSSSVYMPKIITKGFMNLKKETFTHFSNASPVKSRVQHFERLAEVAAGNLQTDLVTADGPTRVTRTKTRAMAAKDTETEVVAKPDPPPPTKKVSRSKIATPISARTIAQLKLPLPVPSSKQTSVKLGPGGSNFSSSESLMSPKPQNSVQNIVREDDAMRKREAMLQARSEEQKRKREEKSRAAAQARQQQTMLKQAQQEKAEKEREEKNRQQQIEREERHREESEKKRIASERKAFELEERRRLDDALRHQQEEEARRQAHTKRKQQEENEKQRKKMIAEERELAAARKLQEMKSQAAASKMLGSKKTASSNSQQPPSYLTFKELGTDDESEDERPTKRHVPIWTKHENRRKYIKTQAFLKPSFIDTLYSTTKFTPNLADIFPRIDKRKLVRSSSAHWRTPPRYSMMPKE